MISKIVSISVLTLLIYSCVIFSVFTYKIIRFGSTKVKCSLSSDYGVLVTCIKEEI